MRRLLDRAIFGGLLALTATVAVPFGSVDPWWEGAFEACVFALGALWMVEGALGGGAWLVREHRLLVPFVALLAFACAQTLPLAGVERVAGVEVRQTISADPFETWRFALKLAALVLAAALFLRYTSSRRRLRALAYVVVAVGLASAVFGVLRQLMMGESLAFVSPRLAENRDGYAQFINRNHFAFLAEMTLGLALGLALGARRRPARLPFYVAAAISIWAALVLSNSRGGILAMFALLACTAWLQLSPGGRGTVGGPGGERARRGAWLVRAVASAVSLAAVLAGVLWLGGERLAVRLEAVPGDISTEASSVRWGDRRTEIWGATWALFKSQPLAGSGFGAYRAAVTAHHDASGEMSLEQAHNDYLELLASGGLVGAALVAWAVVAFVLRSRAVLRSEDPERRALAVGALGGLFAAAVHSLFDFGLHVTVNALVFVALAAVATAEEGRRQKAEGRKQKAESSEQKAEGGSERQHVLATAFCLLLSAFCFWAAWHSARAGVSRLLSESAPRLAFTEYESQATPLAEAALRLAPADPEAHYARAVAWAQAGDLGAAVRELEQEAAGRPRFFRAWLRLGRARERAGDVEGALATYAESARLAPAYAEPRWQLGNTLLRAGRLEEAFTELRRAAASRPSLFPYTVELAWRSYGGDARAVEQAVAPETARARVSLARFFVKHGEAGRALELWRAAEGGAVGEEERRALFSEMIAAGRYAEARAVWAGAEDAAREAGLTNGGFESPTGGGDAQGFDWRFARGQAGVTLSLDASAPHGGARSLLVQFDGAPDPAARLASQLVLAEPRTRRCLRFAARTEGLVSGARPTVAVLSAAGERVLAESPPLPQDTNGWREYELEFDAPSGAVIVAVRRAGCAAPPCPIFGRAWFDDFSLGKVTSR